MQPVEAVPPVDAPPPPDGFVDLCLGVGVQPLVEHGIWRGEVLGLEVVRVVDDPELGNQQRLLCSKIHLGSPQRDACLCHRWVCHRCLGHCLPWCEGLRMDLRRPREDEHAEREGADEPCHDLRMARGAGGVKPLCQPGSNAGGRSSSH